MKHDVDFFFWHVDLFVAFALILFLYCSWLSDFLGTFHYISEEKIHYIERRVELGLVIVSPRAVATKANQGRWQEDRQGPRRLEARARDRRPQGPDRGVVPPLHDRP